MSPEEMKSFDRLIGGLEVKVDSFKESWAEQDRRATEGRRFLFEKMETIGHEVNGLKFQVQAVVKDVQEMKPAVVDWVTTKASAMGAKSAVGVLGNVAYLFFGGLIAAVGWASAHLSLWVHAP